MSVACFLGGIALARQSYCNIAFDVVQLFFELHNIVMNTSNAASGVSQTIGGMITGPKLRAIRALRGITQAALAEKAGVTQAAIAGFEVGKRDLRGDTIRKLCEALGVQVVYKIDGTEITGP